MKTPQNYDLSVVIPAFNEERRIGQTLEKILAFLNQEPLQFEVLVVDDGSTDTTQATAAAFSQGGVKVLQLPENQGKGAAVKEGVMASLGKQVLVTDADLSTPIEDFLRLAEALPQASVVLGSRAVPESKVILHQPLYREVMGKVFNKMLWLAGVRHLRDTQCGFKLLEGEVARDLFARLVTPGFAFDVELVWLAQRLGHRVVEVGVTWRNSPDSKVSPLLDPPRMILEILRFRWIHRRLSTVKT